MAAMPYSLNFERFYAYITSFYDELFYEVTQKLTLTCPQSSAEQIKNTFVIYELKSIKFCQNLVLGFPQVNFFCTLKL